MDNDIYLKKPTEMPTYIQIVLPFIHFTVQTSDNMVPTHNIVQRVDNIIWANTVQLLNNMYCVLNIIVQMRDIHTISTKAE